MHWLTPTETIAVVNALEPRTPLTLRQLRYLDRGEILRPARSGDDPNAGRLYTAQDVAMLRLVVRVLAVRSYRDAWGALVYLQRELREALTGRGTRVLVFQGRKASVMAASDAQRLADADIYPLADCVRGVAEKMRQQRQEAPEVWVGNAWATATTIGGLAKVKETV